MSSGKKGKKTKGKSLSLGEFLGASNPPGGSSAVIVGKPSWAEESEDYEEDRFNAPERLVLPTAPRTARGPDVDPERIPTHPPFTAYIANLPFEVSEFEIEKFFNDLKIVSIRLPRDGGENGRFKGFGYVEFETRSELVEALAKNGDNMGNRKIRIDVAEGDGGNQRKGYNDRGGRDRDEDRFDRSEGVSDWRNAPKDERDDRSPPRGGGFDRDNWGGGRDRGGFGDRDRGGFGDRDRDRGGFGDRDRGGFGDRDRGGFGDRDRGGFGDRDRGGFGDRDRGGFGDRDRGGYRDRYGDRDRDSRYGGDRRGGGGRDFEDRGREEPRERPKLNLIPRSAPAEEGKKGGAAGGGIFGDARPVDTATRELEIEKKIKGKDTPAKREGEVSQSGEESSAAAQPTSDDSKEVKVNGDDNQRGEYAGRGGSRGGPPSSSSNIFGSAKPVDTSSRERQIDDLIQQGRRDDDTRRGMDNRRGDDRRGDDRRGDDRRGDDRRGDDRRGDDRRGDDRRSDDRRGDDRRGDDRRGDDRRGDDRWGDNRRGYDDRRNEDNRRDPPARRGEPIPGLGKGGGGRSSGSSGAGSNIFGSAKPVDTSAREREIEERLKKVNGSTNAGGNKDDQSNRRFERRDDQRDYKRDDKDDRKDKGESRRVRDDREKGHDHDKNEDSEQSRKGKTLKDEPVIIDTSNKFATLDLEEEE